MHIIGVKTQLFKPLDNLLEFIDCEITRLKSGDIVIITSKIVALAQGRVGSLADKQMLIEQEAEQTIDTPWATLTLTADGWCLNAGVDESNADNQLILLPHEPFEVAREIQQHLMAKFSLSELGVVITDTKSLPLRAGTMSRALSYSGFKPLKSYIGKTDLFGRVTRLTESNVADALAASAGLVMGEGNEQTPLAIISDAPVEFTDHTTNIKNTSLSLSPENDIFAKVFTTKPKPKPKK
ncbi:MAG: coenzyme F420-0:L-glutamate ligase [Candidatus Vogelbacteria bacterium]|nr:coenzyme F420-0:L-glutamate ligase [Candidatus Vogelbacteria bacterium]